MDALKSKVLAIDDDESILMLFDTILPKEGFNVVSTPRGGTGITMAHDEKPDLIILDIMMPKLNGYHVCRMLKFDEKYKSIPIIFLTARGQQYDKDVGKEVSADSYIAKPFDGEVLLKEVNRLLGKK